MINFESVNVNVKNHLRYKGRGALVPFSRSRREEQLHGGLTRETNLVLRKFNYYRLEKRLFVFPDIFHPQMTYFIHRCTKCRRSTE